MSSTKSQMCIGKPESLDKNNKSLKESISNKLTSIKKRTQYPNASKTKMNIQNSSFPRLELTKTMESLQYSTSNLLDKNREEKFWEIPAKMNSLNEILESANEGQSTCKISAKKELDWDIYNGPISITNKYRQRKALLGLSSNIQQK